MSRAEEGIYQQHLDEPHPQQLWQFYKETYIYIRGSRNGIELQETLTAKLIELRKGGRYSIWEAKSTVLVWQGGTNYWHLKEGVIFQALKSKAHEINIS